MLSIIFFTRLINSPTGSRGAFVGFFLFFLCFKVSAQQITLSEKPDEFIANVKTMMTGDNRSLVAADKLASLWLTTLDSTEKKAIIRISRQMLKKNYKPSLQFTQFYEMLAFALNKAGVRGPNFEDLISTTEKVVEKLDTKTVLRYLETTRLFFDKRLLYSSNFNKLYALNGVYKIKFIEETPNISVVIDTTKKDTKSIFDDWDMPVGNIVEEAKSLETATEKKPLPKLGIGIQISLKSVDFAIVTASDSVIISNTAGTLGLREGWFVGNGGVMSFANVGLKTAFVSLSDYAFEIRNPKIQADDVSLAYPDKLDGPIKGVFEFKGEKRAKNVQASYPRFMSYKSNVSIKNVNDANFEYKGGFALSGKRLYSSSVQDKFAYITIKQNGKVVFKSMSTLFELGDSLVTTRQGSFVGYFDKDSIQHPAVKLIYNKNTAQLKLNKVDAGGFRDAPYSDSYHRLFIKTDAMRWNLKDNRMDFYIITSKGVVPALFESFDYFNPQRFVEINSSTGFNPLMAVGNFVKTNKKTTFSDTELSQFSKRDLSMIQAGLMSVFQKGYVNYDPTTGIFKLNSKGEHYILAYTGKKDFDNYLIASFYNSKDSLTNATLNLQDKILTVRGAKRFYLSDTLDIFAMPRDQIVKIGKNRSFNIDGQLKAKNFRFAGKDLAFDYTTFKFDLKKIDSITFTPQTVYRKGGIAEIGGHIKYEKSGELFLNKADNKSGRIYHPEFPKLLVPDGVTVFFKEPARGKRIYNKNVYFTIPTIDYDSLNVRDVEFVGTFYSDGIFDPFKEVLVAMPDTSLGFTHRVSNSVYTTYGKNSSVKFGNNLTMNLSGLKTKGEISHLSTKLVANDILFMTDSLIASGITGNISEATIENGYFPKVDVKNYALRWLPKKDSMIVSSNSNFDFYAGTSALKGKLIVRSKGLFGIGKLTRTDSETDSDQFKFNKEGFTADLAQFRVKSSLTSSKPVLLGQNVDVNFNVVSNMVNITTASDDDFKNTKKISNLEFPYASYSTSIDRAEWNIKAKTISMRGDVSSSTFTSINPEQEGLSFNGSAAIYEIDKMTLNISGVPFVKAADARIIPDKGQVAVRRDAEMMPFSNARLEIDTLNSYHKLINGNIQILSKRKFVGDATYQFVNISKDTFNIKMGDFELKEFIDTKKIKSFYTNAKASVTEKEGVFLSPRVLYKGDIMMVAYQKNLTLDGFVRPELKKYPKFGGYWISYKGNKSENVTINVDKNLKSEDQNLFVGLHHRATGGLYASFLSAKESEADNDIFLSSGIFSRDEKNRQFIVTTPDVSETETTKNDKKANQTNASIGKEYGIIQEGNKYAFIDNQGLMKMEGKFKFLHDKEAPDFQASGNMKLQVDSAKYLFSLMTLLPINLPPPILAAMGERIVKTNLDEGNSSGAIQYDNPEFLSKLTQFIGGKATETYRAKAIKEHQPLYTAGQQLLAGLVFSELKLKWSEKQNAFYSEGAIGVSHIGNTDINARMAGMVEIRKGSANGEEFYIYFEASPDVWYYISYHAEQMSILASDPAFNDLLSARLKKSKKESKEIQLATFDERAIFVNRFNETYKGIKRPTRGTSVVKKAEPTNTSTSPSEKKKEEKKDEKEGF